MLVARIAVAVALLTPTLAFAQAETPSPTPAVSPIPVFNEKKTATASTSTTDAASKAVRIDRGGMFGAGFGIGNESTGVTAKLWFTEEMSAQFGAGAGPFGNNVRFQLDLLYAFYRFDPEDGQYSLPFYAGLGGQTGIYLKNPYPVDRTDLGMRVPFGMSVVVPNNPVELFFEIAPDVGIYRQEESNAAGTGTETKTHGIFYVDGQIGARFYF